MRLADSTVALFDADNTAPDASGERVALKTKPLGAHETAPVCSDERFYGQPVGAFCSGFLIGPDLIMTAAHCADASIGFPVPECSNMRIVFGFSLRDGEKTPTSLPAGEVYRCAGLVARPEEWLDEDWAIIRLDRAVTGHEPLRLNASGGLRPGTPVFAIGHPAGLPTKITGPAKVVSVDEKTFRTDLDIFNGNSGGPVVNAKTGLVEGIVSEGGGPDYQPRGNGECWESNRLRDGGATRPWGAVAAKVPQGSMRRRLRP
ncbi:MAG: serine protease [Elusimicrobia bacterium]|nr:serine protease [Elusimicrobiota bacterium]